MENGECRHVAQIRDEGKPAFGIQEAGMRMRLPQSWQSNAHSRRVKLKENSRCVKDRVESSKCLQEPPLVFGSYDLLLRIRIGSLLK